MAGDTWNKGLVLPPYYPDFTAVEHKLKIALRQAQARAQNTLNRTCKCPFSGLLRLTPDTDFISSCIIYTVLESAIYA
jgi:hypothetical protein